MRRPVRIPKKVDLNRIEDYADKVMDPVDVEFTNHFFDRLTRSEHKKDITNAELIGFFKRLSKKKKQFDEFMQRYDEFVAKDKRTDINIPFKSNVDQIIAKTIMRKKDFKTSNAEYKFENYKYNMKYIKIYEQFINDLDKQRTVIESVNESKKPAIPLGMEQFQKDEKDEGRQADIYLATFDGNSFDAQSTNKTWDDGVPVTKYFTRGGYKSVSPKGQHYIIEGDGFWYFRIGSTWYAVKRYNYGSPPFDY